MTGSATVVINPAPAIFTVTGGGGYCSGGTGSAVGLSGSAIGISYRLYRGTVNVSTVPGTGSPISFGLQTVAGTYTVVAYNSGTTCTSNMTGSAIITVNPVPTIGTTTLYTLMPGHTITLTGTPTGGAWASGTPAHATIGATSGLVSGVALGTTSITYTLPTGCYATHGVSVTVTGFRETPGTAPVVTAAITSDLSVAPNPSKGTFTIKGTLGTTDDMDVTLMVTDMLGRTVYTSTITAQNGNIEETIKLNNIARGTYLLNVHTTTENKVFHVVVQE
jgi:hypothetical protein